MRPLLALLLALAQPSPPPGRLIDLGGWRIHLHGTGERQPGAPLVVLEAGLGAFSVDWALVQPLVARSARGR